MRVSAVAWFAWGVACSAPPAENRESRTAGATPPAALARDTWKAGLDTLVESLSALEGALARVDGSDHSVALAKQAFVRSRLAFKRIEFASSYYEPTTTAKLNGPALPRPDDDEGPEIVFPPEGLQVIEEWLYGGADLAQRETIVVEAANSRSLALNLLRSASVQEVTDNRLWEAASHEIARVSTLGITGFDSPVAQLSLEESAAALDGVYRALQAYQPQLDARDPALFNEIETKFSSARAMLSRCEPFGDFNRLRFIVEVSNPLARAIFHANRQLALIPPRDRRAFRADVASIFDSAAFDASAFANPASEPDSPEQAELGAALFNDARLSGDGKQSCASCHDAARAFTDGRVRSVSRTSEHAATMRNTPTVINAGLQNGLFADQRTMFLEDQVEAVLNSEKEMHSSGERAARILSTDSVRARQFAAAFSVPRDSAVSALRIRKAIAAYVRSLTALNSRVDVAMRGDTTVLTNSERRGFNLFTGKAKCATCHFLPLFNGSVPPTYRSSDVEVLGVPARAATHDARIDPDSGRYAVTRSAPHLFAFKTPGVRNVAITAPYMHNGVYRTLEEVVDFYARGGGIGIGIALGNQTLPFDSLQLTKSEQGDIVQFLKALTDTSSFRKPVARRP